MTDIDALTEAVYWLIWLPLAVVLLVATSTFWAPALLGYRLYRRPRR